MSNSRVILALDQGTTSSRAILFDSEGCPIDSVQEEFRQILPAPGLVEHDPEEIWATQLRVAQRVVERYRGGPDAIAAIGVTNQRETTVLWDRTSGEAVAPAVVWQSRASEPICRRLKQEGCEPLFRQKTGLLLDPYFSGTKIRYLLDRDPALQQRAEAGELLFGTIDSFLICGSRSLSLSSLLTVLRVLATIAPELRALL